MKAPSLAEVRHIALDMDGTIYRGGTLFPCTLPFLEQLEGWGIRYSFLTNNSSKSAREYGQGLRALGIEADVADVRISTHSAIDYLRKEHPDVRRIFSVGTRGLREELSADGYSIVDTDPEWVVVGFDPHLAFDQLCRAAFWIQKGVPYLATHPDRVCPTDKPTVLIDCGALCAALKSATGRAPAAVLGKPHPLMLSGLLAREGLDPRSLLVVGDRLYTDIAMAHAAGALGALVLSGEATATDVASARPDEQPHFVFQDLADLGQALAAARSLSKHALS